VRESCLRSGITALIDREIAHAHEGRPARIIVKNNALTDPAMIRAFYRASREGVEIDLIVRGACALRSGVPGVSEQIRVARWSDDSSNIHGSTISRTAANRPCTWEARISWNATSIGG
jgi:hypothetical protein